MATKKKVAATNGSSSRSTWSTAVCNFEAMQMCAKRFGGTQCGFDEDQPESNGGAFGFMRKVKC